LRVAWFASVRDGAIADYSRGVLAAMVRLCEPHLFCHGSPERLPAGVAVTDLAAQTEALAELPSFDAVFYNLGNDFRQHAWIFDVARLHPGVVVVHDVSLHRFFLDYYLEHLRRPDLYVARMAHHYGLAGLTTANRVLAPWFHSGIVRADEADLLRYTFIEEALQYARGAIVDSRWRATIVQRLWVGPVCGMWPPPQRPSASSVPAQNSSEVGGDGVITVMTLSPVDPRSHVAEVIEVLAGDPELAAHTRYVIAGPHDPRDPYVNELNAMIAESGLAGVVMILGERAPAEVDRLARAADLFVSLRDPEDEWGPMSLMYQLPFGKAVIAYDTGSVAELPAGTVAKVAVGDRAQLHKRLRQLVSTAARRRAIGDAAKGLAELHSARDYAKRLLRFAMEDANPAGAERLSEEAWRAIAERIASDIGASLASLGVTPGSPGLEAVIRESRILLWPPCDTRGA
jgi:glycosyltransferase involved in cell wall biosynthesis